MNPEELQAEAIQLESELMNLSQPVQQEQEPLPEEPQTTLQGQISMEAQPKKDKGFHLLDLLRDLLTGLIGGGRNAIQNTGSLIHDLAGGDYQPTLSIGPAASPEEEQIIAESPFKIPGVFAYVPSELAQKHGIQSQQMIDLPDVEKPKTIAGQITQGVTQFGVGFVGGGRLLQGLGWAKGTAPLLRAGTAGGLSDFTVFNAHEERLSNLIEQFPALHNPITDYLKADPKDAQAEGRFKNVLEGMMLGGATDVLFKGVKQLKQVRQMRAKEGDEAAAKFLAKNVGEVDDVLKKSNDELLDDIFGTSKPQQQKVPVEVRVQEVDASKTMEATSVTATVQEQPIPRNTKPLSEEQMDAFRKQLQEASGKEANALIDFNADTMVTGNEVKQVLDTMSKINREEMFKLKGGVQSLDEIEYKAVQILESEAKDVADLLGTDATNLLTALSRDAKNVSEQASRLVAGKQFMQSLARRISDLANRIDSGIGTDKEQLELLRHIDILSDVEANLKAIQTGSARTTSAGRIRTGDILFDEEIADILDQVGGSDNVRKLARRIKGAGKDGGNRGIIQLVRKSWLDKLVDVHNEVWMNAILSGPKTHAVNVLGNGINTVFLPGEKILGGVLTGNKDVIIEGASTYYGLMQALGDSLNMAWRSFQMEDNMLDPLGRVWDADSRKAISARNFDLPEGSMLSHGVDWLGQFTRLSGRFLMSEDEFFKQINYRASVRAKAIKEGLQQGYNGKELGEFVENRFRQAFDEQGRATQIDPLKYSREATFTQELTDDTFLGRLGGTIQRGVNRHPVLGRAIFPFVRVPTNLLQFVSDRTPFIAPLNRQFRADVLAGGERRANALGKVATGSMFYTYATMLAMDGQITGSGPSEPELRQQLMTTGWRPYSFVETLPDGSKKYTPFNRIDPFGMFFGLVADFAQTAGQNDDRTNEDLATAMVLSLANNINNKAYFKGLVDVLSVFGWNNYNQEGSTQHLLQSRMASYIPNSLQMFRDDHYLRETRNWMDRINNKLGFGQSRALDPKRNMFGEPVLLPPGYGAFDVQPFVSSTRKPDPVLDELARLSNLGVQFTLPANTIQEGRIDLTQFRNGEGQTAADRRRALMNERIKGHPTVKDKFAEIIQSDKYRNASDDTGDYEGGKAMMLKRVYEKYKQAALMQLMQEDFRDESGRTLREIFDIDRKNKIRTLRGQLDQLIE